MFDLVLFSRFDNALQLFWAFSPGERTAIGVVLSEKPLEKILEVFLGPLYAVRQALLGQDTEEALD